jgi:hypothetical protein
MRATIWGGHVVDLITRDRRPYAVHFNLKVAIDHTALCRPAIHYITARAAAAVPPEFRVKILVPFAVTDPAVSLLCHGSYTETYADDSSAQESAKLAAVHATSSSPEAPWQF